MGTLFIVLGAAWFVLALVFTFALAAAGTRHCSNLESPAKPFVPQAFAPMHSSQTPPLFFGARDAMQGA